jgi:Uma2 family endonuclease
MSTVLKLGRADHGRPMTLGEFMAGDYEEGYQYELIDGRLYVVPSPDLPFDRMETWLWRKLDAYSQQRPEIINYVSAHARTFVPGRPGETCPEPDVTAFRDFPHHLPFHEVRWQDLLPVLVVEVLSADDPDKDLVRNVELYLEVPSIREYWILDHRESLEHPCLLVYRKRGRRWQRPITVEPGETYTTRLLPGFELIVDPRS